MNNTLDLLNLLEYIDPSILTYQEWVNVGMGLKQEGYTASDWDRWSTRDTKRYRNGECFTKWMSFQGSNSPVTGGTIYQMAVDGGYVPLRKDGHALDWDDEIKDDLVVVDQAWLEGQDIEEPNNWEPAKELIKYLEILFDSTENVGYVTATWEKDGKYLPTKGHWDRTSGQLIQELNQCNGDIGAVLGDYKEQAGAWIRFNPLDGIGCKNDNVVDFRYALVESDSMELDKQNAIIRELELPVACLVHSGKKSIHAIVRVDASNYDEYRKRVDYLYTVCKKNGLEIDQQNKNPSRLSRMPGIMRNGKKQFLIDTNIGKSNWNEWFEWIEGVNDDLPDPESLDSFFDDLPDLAPPLIHGILRQGHKMLMAGPSKAGKSYALIELCVAIAEGDKWMGWNCEQGKVMYVNLELDRASCLHRFKDVYTAMGVDPNNLKNIDIWNLRGKSVPMDKLAPKLIRRAHKKNYTAIIIDPIYKVITGDENSADQMAHFCNQFDRVCTDLGSAVIYCHHHSKGYQGGKRSMDRASGSGVFARDPDALIDLTELSLSDELVKHEKEKAAANYISLALQNLNQDYFEENVGLDDTLSRAQMLTHANRCLTRMQYIDLEKRLDKVMRLAGQKTAWRIEGTLREFAGFEPVNVWFDYPIHKIDDSGVLKDVMPEAEKPPWQKGVESRKPKEKKKEERQNKLEIAFANLEMDHNEITVNDLSQEMGVSNRTVWRRIKEHGGFDFIRTGDGKASIIYRKEEENTCDNN
ncbi:AAA family ATPase [Peptostreptococcus equinus]|uniref:AAA family ATPase n=1 Tax=Peptostreptococcus equinus TaxID=3003601 RepID=A0ABY7JSI7_9FIRM|nr:AAA family ATPase [Peptostreptococcus sp. CBA3647]WAW15436.1 AAA family ATPase [Peptostreptococcus sp. CBA3647]